MPASFNWPSTMIRVILAQQPSIKGRARARLALGALVDGLQG